MRALTLATLLLFCAGPAGAEEDGSPAGTRAFDAWSATCDNVGSCVAMATAPDVFFYVRIARDAGATADPSARLSYIAGDEPSAKTAVFTLVAKTNAKATDLGHFETALDAGSRTATVNLGAGQPSLAFIEAIRDADDLAFTINGESGTLTLKGLSAALRWIDAAQKRAGTPSALVARGMTPLGQVPDAPRPPQVRAAPPGSAHALDAPKADQTVLDMAAALADCDGATVKAHEGLEAWSLGEDRTLIAVPCVSGAYNLSTALYLTGPAGQNPRPLALPQAPGDDGGTTRNILVNGGFDPKTMTLSDFAKGRGLGDCGESRTWLWTGTGFALLEANRLDACPGAPPEDWPRVYVAKRID